MMLWIPFRGEHLVADELDVFQENVGGFLAAHLRQGRQVLQTVLVDVHDPGEIQHDRLIALHLEFADLFLDFVQPLGVKVPVEV